jgi:hypothetical protein
VLTQVPQAVNHQTRMVTLYHPNAMDCTVWRKQVKRVEVNPDTGAPSVDIGAPTLGGLGVLRSEDEDNYEYVELGAGKCLFCGQYQPNDVNERDDNLVQANAQEAQVEAIASAGAAGHFVVDTNDLVQVSMGLGAVMAFEVVTVTGSVNIPPYNRKLVLNPRDDLHSLEPFAG